MIQRLVPLVPAMLAAGCRLVGVAPPPEAAVPGAPPRSAEVRALWVVRTTLVDADSLRAMVRRADGAGFNALMIQVRGRGDAYYRSRWEPPPDALQGRIRDFDPLALVIREAHARGLRIHAWVNTHLVTDLDRLPADANHLYHARPDLLAVPRPLARELFGRDPQDPGYREALVRYARGNREHVEGLYTIPSHPEVKEHVYSIWMDILERYDVDGLHFDYVRLPGRDYDYSRFALERFRGWVEPRLEAGRRAELEEAYARDPLAYADGLPELWDAFRREEITELVERIYYGVKKRKPRVVVSAAVFANAEDAYRSRFQDWREWLRQRILDVVVPMAYTPDSELFRRQVADAVRAAARVQVWAGIGAYQNTVEGTVEKIDIARALGANGIALFSYDWAVRPGDGNPEGRYLFEVARDAFGARRR
ncbi:MAG: family 10 glycosylhydrolase [Gemmatimonadetes bacterium]|nr:family 10 glycosylhydrolase [Gemmatimonadota bacterium]